MSTRGRNRALSKRIRLSVRLRRTRRTSRILKDLLRVAMRRQQISRKESGVQRALGWAVAEPGAYRTRALGDVYCYCSAGGVAPFGRDWTNA